MSVNIQPSVYSSTRGILKPSKSKSTPHFSSQAAVIKPVAKTNSGNFFLIDWAGSLLGSATHLLGSAFHLVSTPFVFLWQHTLGMLPGCF